MKKTELQNFSSINIICDGKTSVAKLENDIKSGIIIAVMPPTNVVGTYIAAQIPLSDALIKQIVKGKDGKISLDLA